MNFVPIDMNGEKYLATAEVVEMLGVRRETLSKYIKQGLIKPYKRGFGRLSYFKEVDVQALIDSRNTFTPRE